MINLRRAAAAAAAALLAFGLTAAGGGSASAASPPASQYADSSSCHLDNGWGGTFICQQSSAPYWYQMPNGYWEVFVVAPDPNGPGPVYTRWNSSSGLSGWVSLGGACQAWVWIYGSNPGNGWNRAIECAGATGTNGTFNHWYDSRIGAAAGHWTGWRLSPDI